MMKAVHDAVDLSQRKLHATDPLRLKVGFASFGTLGWEDVAWQKPVESELPYTIHSAKCNTLTALFNTKINSTDIVILSKTCEC